MNRNRLPILACAWLLSRVLIGSGPAAVPPQVRAAEPRTFSTALLEIACLAVSPDQRLIAVDGLSREMRGLVEILDWETGEQRLLIRTEAEPNMAARTEVGHQSSYGGVDRVRWIGFSADVRQLAVVTHEGLAFWDVTTGQRLETAMGRTDGSTGTSVHRAAAFSSDGRWFIGGQPPILWDIARQEPQWALPTSTNGFAFSPDSQLLATAEHLNRIHLWRVSDGMQIAEVHGQMGPLYSVALACDGRILAASGEGGARIWDVVVKDGKYAFREHPPLYGMIPFGAVHSMSFSRDGKWLATCGGNLVKVWGGHDSQQLATADRAATSAAFSPDGSALIISRRRDLPNDQLSPGVEATIRLLPIEHVLDPHVLDNQARAAAADLLRVLEQGSHERALGNALFALGPHAHAAVPVLTEALNAKAIETRCIVLHALSLIGPGAKSASGTVTLCLADDAPEVREAAVEALTQMDPETAAQTMARISAQLQMPDKPQLRDGVMTYQGRSFDQCAQRTSVPPLLSLQPDRPPVPDKSAAILRELGGPDTVSRLRAALDSKDDRLRWGAAAALSLFGAQAKEAIPPLRQLLATEPDHAWPGIADALARIVKASDESVPVELTNEFASRKPQHQVPALRAVLHINPQDATAHRMVNEALTGVIEPDWSSFGDPRYEQGSAMLVLVKSLGSDAGFAVPQVAAIIDKPGRTGVHNALRATAAESLGMIGPGAKAAVASLLRALQDRDLSVRASASNALAKVTPGQIPDGLVELTAADNPQQSLAAFWALAHFGELAIAVLQSALKDPDAGRRRRALDALCNTQVSPDILLPILRDVATNDPDLDLRQNADVWAKSFEQQAAQQRAPPPTADPD